MSWKWFGVKTLTRWETIGKPKSIDENFDDDATLIEERVVLIKARSFDEAIKKGENEAKKICQNIKTFMVKKYGKDI